MRVDVPCLEATLRLLTKDCGAAIVIGDWPVAVERAQRLDWGIECLEALAALRRGESADDAARQLYAEWRRLVDAWRFHSTVCRFAVAQRQSGDYEDLLDIHDRLQVA
jgi:hypothetical protein